jgi:ABC-type uncharacterized transport system substrate-binding protein
VIGPVQNYAARSLPTPQFIVAVGVRALEVMLERHAESLGGRVPILATLVPRASYEALVGRVGAAVSAVWLDQPLERYLALIRLAMPERTRLGVLFGPDSESLKPALLKAAAAKGLTVYHATLYAQDDNLYPALRTVLAESQMLLALPDNLVFNPVSLQNILITAYRQRVPLVTYSAAHVKAGATLALHASPVQVAEQTAAAVRAWLGGRGLPAARGMDRFSVAVNAQVGRSLGLSTVEPQALTDALKREDAR